LPMFAEQERLYADELSLSSDSTEYEEHAATHDWTARKTVTFTTTKDLILCVKANFWSVVGASVAKGAMRITIDDKPIWASGGKSLPAGTTTNFPTPDIYVYLASGAHHLDFDTAVWVLGSIQKFGLNSHNVGLLNFNDKLGSITDSGSVANAAGVLTTILNVDVTVPAARKLPVGEIAHYSALIYAVAVDSHTGTTRRTKMLLIGESNVAAHNNCHLFINDVEVDWSDHLDDDEDADATNPTYGLGAKGIYIIGSVTPAQTFNVKVKSYCSTDSHTQVYGQVLLCPWLSPQVDYSPVTLKFGQASTFYAILEPLNTDTSKSSKLGKTRFHTFGDATDFYDVDTGTGILLASYTFEVVDVESCSWIVSCTSIICISYLGVDLF